MLSDIPLAGPDIPEFRDPRFRPAIAVSLLLHAGLALALGRVVSRQVDNDTAPLATSIVVLASSPQRRRASTTYTSDATQTVVSNLPAVADSVDNAAQAATEPDTAGNAPSPIPAPADEGVIALDPQVLQNSIDSFLSNYRSEALEQDLQECQQYRDRYARWDCPQGDEPNTETRARIDENMQDTFRDWAYGRDLNVPIAEKLMTEMLTLRPLAQDEGVMGEVARDLQYLKAAEYGRLTGNLGDNGLWIGPPPSAVGGTITVLSIGIGGITLPNGVTIGWDGKVHEAPRAPAPRPSAKDD